VKARMLKESEFGLKQAFAFCPYSPEAVYHLMVLFYEQRRFEDIQMILRTCNDLDPYNGQFNYWLTQVNAQLDQIKSGRQSMTIQQLMTNVEQAIKEKRNAEAEAMVDALTGSPQAEPGLLVQCAQWYQQIGKLSKGTAAMQKVVGLAPGRWETWFYLARMQALEGKAAESADSLRKAFALNTNDRVNLQGTTLTLHEFVQKDGSFDPIRGTPEYQKAMATNH